MIVSTIWLAEHLTDPNLAVVDVRNVWNQPDAGRRMYLEGHVPRSVFLAMDTDLADRSDLSKGRHPLPDPKKFVESLARIGIGKGTRVIAYDDSSGSSAARLWWMMRWIGAPEAAVLDGGITKWVQEGRTLETGESRVAPALDRIDAKADNSLLVDKRTVARAKELGLLLLDARSPERYRGESEPIDAKAGHIPGAINAPWDQNVAETPVPVLKKPPDLKKHYSELGVSDPARTVCYCGSGVTACLDILALEVAGLRGAKLFPGSWSEWIAEV